MILKYDIQWFNSNFIVLAFPRGVGVKKVIFDIFSKNKPFYKNFTAPHIPQFQG